MVRRESLRARGLDRDRGRAEGGYPAVQPWLPTSTAVLALVDAPPGDLTPALVTGVVPIEVALVVGAAFGIVGAILGEVLQRVLYAHAETHLDPPAASIVVTSFLIGVLAIVGVLPSSVWVPTP